MSLVLNKSSAVPVQTMFSRKLIGQSYVCMSILTNRHRYSIYFLHLSMLYQILNFFFPTDISDLEQQGYKLRIDGFKCFIFDLGLTLVSRVCNVDVLILHRAVSLLHLSAHCLSCPGPSDRREYFAAQMSTFYSLHWRGNTRLTC